MNPKDRHALLELLPFVAASVDGLVPMVAFAIERVFMRTSPIDLASFDGWCRRVLHWNVSAARLGDERGAVALASFHPSGFVREAAVHRLAAMSDGFEIPFLIIRANDWVSAVHDAALRALRRRLSARYVRPLARCMALLDRLCSERTRHQRDLVDFRARVEALLASPEGAGEVERLLATGALADRRAAVRVAARMPPTGSRTLLLRASRDPDPVVAARGAHALLMHPLDSALRVELMAHRLGAVRAKALEALGDEHELREALLDAARQVREMARYELARRGSEVRFTEIYREALTIAFGARRLAALEGLAEVAEESDLPTLRAFAKEPNAGLRAAAIEGLGRTGGASERDALLAALEDPSPHVRRAARPHVKRLFGRLALKRA